MTLKDMLIAGKLAGGGGGEEPSGTKQISISANGTTTHNIKDYASAEITAAVPNSYTAGDEGKVVSSGALVSQSSDSVTQNGTVDTTLINSLTVNVAGNMGGLANMVDVNTQDYQLAYMLMKMKKGETKGGTITYTDAFPNTDTKILETGLSEIHGVMFVATGIDARATGGSNASYKWLILTVNSDDTYNAVGMAYTSNTNANGKVNLTQGVTDTVPQGAFTFTGGDVYYKARYNKNANYQCLIIDQEYDWLAW